jgi:hypothetical protein
VTRTPSAAGYTLSCARFAPGNYGARPAVIESKFVNPDPQHCPPVVTQVLFHEGTDQVRRALGYFQPHPAE